jgi:hypothetical protein
MLVLTCPGPFAGGGAPPTFTYSLLDQFTTDQAAPLGNRTAEPGPGSWTVVDTNSKFSIASGRLVVPGGFTNTDRFVSASNARANGRAFLWEHPTHATQSSVWRAGWFTNGTSGTTPELGIQLSTSNTQVVLRNQGTSIETVTIGSAEHCFAMIMRGTGGYFLTRNGMSGDYKLEWVHSAGTAAMFAKGAAAGTNAMSLTTDNCRVTDLGGIWATQYGLATNRLVSPANGAMTTATADALIEISSTPDGVNSAEVVVRRSDANNYWSVLCEAGTGDLVLRKVASGTPSEVLRATSAFPSLILYRVIIIVEGNNYKVYVNNVRKANYTDATNFNTSATGVVINPAQTSVIDELICWPRFVDLQGA